MPVLHLIDAASPQACPSSLALLAETVRHGEPGEHRTLLLGGTALERDANAASLTNAQRLSVPFGHALLGLPAVIRTLKQIGPLDLIHAWSLETLRVARLLRVRTPRALTLTQPPCPNTCRGLLRLLAGPAAAPTHLVCTRAAYRDQLVEAGVEASAIRVLGPRCGTTAAALAQRQAVRQSWGIRDASVKVVAVLSDPPAAADAQVATMTASLVQETLGAAGPPPFRLAVLVHPQQRHRPRSQRMLHELGHPLHIIQDARLATPWQVLPGCDAALCFGAHAGGLSLAWALAAGCPVVAEPAPAVHELIEHEHNGLIAPTGRPKSLAYELHRLLTDPALADRLTAHARPTTTRPHATTNAPRPTPLSPSRV